MNSNTPERFPIFSIFGLFMFGFYACTCAVFLYFSAVPAEPVAGVAFSRLFVAAGLPRTSIIPMLKLGPNGQPLQAWRYLEVQAREPALRAAADWLVWWLPLTSFFLASSATYFTYRKPKNEKVVRGTQVRKS